MRNKRNSKAIGQAIMHTLAYAEIFSYPLTYAEIYKFLSYRRALKLLEYQYEMTKLAPYIESSGNYFALRDIKKLVSLRKRRNQESHKKLGKAFFVSQILSAIPTIKLIGVSGSVAVGNADKKDDIDLFIITRKNTVWITRFLVFATLRFLRSARRRGETVAPDKICANMFVSEDKMGFAGKRRNLYIAHEIIQMKPVFEKENTYARFISKNKWVKKFLPHALPPVKTTRKKRFYGVTEHAIRLLDYIFYFAQKLYMRKRTHEVVLSDRAEFHPTDRQTMILELYELKKQGIKTVQEPQKRRNNGIFLTN